MTLTIRLLSNIAVRAVEEPDFRDIVTTPPRTGKSQLLAVWEVVWALMRNPDLQIVLVSYSDQTRPSAQPRGAAAHQRARRLPRVPVVVGQDGSGPVARQASRGWAACDRDQQRRHGFRSRPDGDRRPGEGRCRGRLRRRVITEYRSTLATRVHPGGSVLLVMTRWHERVNYSTPNPTSGPIPMSRRSPRPACPRAGPAPSGAVKTVIGVDPSDSGSGDACGIVAASLTGEGVVAVTADVSA